MCETDIKMYGQHRQKIFKRKQKKTRDINQ